MLTDDVWLTRLPDLDVDLVYSNVDISHPVPSLTNKFNISFGDCSAHNFRCRNVARNKLKESCL
jgi:hypothetical protein